MLTGRAWSGAAPIARVEAGIDGLWIEANLHLPEGSYEWTAWRLAWNATPGEHELACRATDGAGNVQPLEPPWDLSGFGNNAVQRVQVTVRD